MPTCEEIETNKNNRLIELNKELEAALCALLSQLKKEKNGEIIIREASKNSRFDISEFIERHGVSDRNRVIKSFNEYLDTLSEHEKNILEKELKSGE
jgi:hypothetical protein